MVDGNSYSNKPVMKVHNRIYVDFDLLRSLLKQFIADHNSNTCYDQYVTEGARKYWTFLTSTVVDEATKSSKENEHGTDQQCNNI